MLALADPWNLLSSRNPWESSHVVLAWLECPYQSVSAFWLLYKVTLIRQLSKAEAIPKEHDIWRHFQQLEQQVLLWRGIWVAHLYIHHIGELQSHNIHMAESSIVFQPSTLLHWIWITSILRYISYSTQLCYLTHTYLKMHNTWIRQSVQCPCTRMNTPNCLNWVDAKSEHSCEVDRICHHDFNIFSVPYSFSHSHYQSLSNLRHKPNLRLYAPHSCCHLKNLFYYLHKLSTIYDKHYSVFCPQWKCIFNTQNKGM